MAAILHFLLCWFAGVATVGFFAGLGVWRDERLRNPDVPLRVGKLIAITCLVLLAVCGTVAFMLFPQPCL